MNQAEQALRELREMDALASRTSFVHTLCPLTKLFATIAYIAVVVSFGKYDLAGLAPLALWPVLLFQWSGVPLRACFRKLRFVLPLVLAVGLFNPIFDRAPYLVLGTLAVSGGVVSMVTLACKGVLCLMASFLLAATTRVDALCAALRRLRVPGVLVTLLLLTCRYVGVMTEEVAIMSYAYALRAPGQRGVAFRAWGSFLGQLLLRSMDRASELFDAMLLRGFREEFRYADAAPCTARDAAYLAASLGVFALLRFVRVAPLLGGLLVK